jgi:diguanylate cyclase (GGDEF)-like protein
MHLSIAEKTHQETTSLLYGQSLSIVISNPLATLLMVLWLMPVAPLNELVIWFIIILTISLSRLALYIAYKKQPTKYISNFWLHAWTLGSALTALTHAIGLIYFTPLDQPVYVASVGMIIIGLSAISVIAFGASIYAVLSFFIPVTLPIILYFLYSPGVLQTYVTAGVLLYAAVVLSALKQINKAFKNSISLNFQHQQEIEKRKFAERKLQELSRRDSLTKLFNRRHFDEFLNIEINKSLRNDSPLCLVLFDIDCFKQFNDQYGHVAGDKCLAEVARITTQVISRKEDFVARYGGEEFVFVLPNTDIISAVALATKLQLAIQSEHLPHTSTLVSGMSCITISAGVASLKQCTDKKSESLIEIADKSLYEAKKLGRNQVCFNNTVE